MTELTKDAAVQQTQAAAIGVQKNAAGLEKVYEGLCKNIEQNFNKLNANLGQKVEVSSEAEKTQTQTQARKLG